MKANIEALDTNPVPSPVTPIYSFSKFHTSKFKMEKKEVCMSENMTLCVCMSVISVVLIHIYAVNNQGGYVPEKH